MWTEVEKVEIPFGTTIYYTLSKTGNVKYYIKIHNMAVAISKSNAEAFMRKERRLEIVKWYNASEKKYKYTVRKVSSPPNIDLSTIFL